ncbi:uncharacterized protein EV154DRAFT_517152 [Mucor mucedo]|uniref:uncharacterized protein n=1 Tax=Mucor mucedo TaxID=29922 RepID=UPI0022202FCF|nr:uncharacterized protein EV154DRAFT_517152 [Mucor mucedo]KAI7888590.1 hypothetical protein EV154DRAFT_517152 [Mucor mucedo]
MRIKLKTSSPLPKINCWFVVKEKAGKETIHDLRKKITNDLELDVQPSNLQLSMDGFHLLPQTALKDLVRDGDLIT